MKPIVIKSSLTLVFILLLMGCTQVEWNEIDSIKPGYIAFSDSSKVSVILTKDDITGAVTYDPVEINLRFFFTTQVTGFKHAGVTKILQNESYEEVASAEQAVFTDLSDTLSVDILNMESLFEGINFSPDSIRSGYSFLFKTFLVLDSGDTITSSRGDYQVVPQYLNFCTLPEIPLGFYEAHNKATGYKKTVEIRYMELAPAYWIYVITDFGIDWSRWNDFWYGTNFTIGCPLAGDDRFVVKLAAWGIDMPSIRLEMKNDLGELETRPLRIMPWTYADDSPDTGYYDATGQQLIFKNVKVRDTWWGVDNYSIQEVTFTYKGQ
jgi:hypothetical protein